MNTLWAVLLLVYVLSYTVARLSNSHMLACWADAYRFRRPLTLVTLWHPLYAGQWCAKGYPSVPPSDDDWLHAWVFALTPVVNTCLVLTMYVGVLCSLARRGAVALRDCIPLGTGAHLYR